MFKLETSLVDSFKLLKEFGVWVYSVKEDSCIHTLNKIKADKELTSFFKMSSDKTQMLMRVKGKLDKDKAYVFDKDESKYMTNTGAVNNEMDYYSKLTKLTRLVNN